MGLETGTQIGALVPANPPGTDPKSQGDDHLRLIKTCVQGSLGLMDALWSIPGNDTGLKQRNAGNTAYANLINLDASDDIKIGEGSIPVEMFNNLTINGTLTGVTNLSMNGELNGTTNINMTGALAGATTINASGKLTITGGGADIVGPVEITQALTVLSGGAAITGTLTMTGGANITGAVNILGGNNLALSSGSDMSLAGGVITGTQTPGSGQYSVDLTRSSTSSSLFHAMRNLDAAATYRPLAGIYHEDNGDITLGGVQNDATFQIKQNTIRLGNLPTSAAGLGSGDLYRSGTTVLVNL